MSGVRDPIAQTEHGRVRGVDRSEHEAYYGIPFAKPPVGALRFAPPTAPDTWDGVRPAIAYGPTAQRMTGSTETATLIPEPSIPGDEILTVNVFTPAADPAGKLPVMVWIHGGGYDAGSPASPWYDGASFARHGIVTVTIGYRLGFDGFGAIPGEPTNLAVRDWLAALAWVQRNIAAFGGDPGRVTIAGQSAGGGAVLTLLGMPAAQGLFRAAWASSAVIPVRGRADAESVTRRVAESLGVPATREALADVPDERFARALAAATSLGDKPSVAMMLAQMPIHAPLVDGELIPEPTLAAFASGVGADVPLIIGSNDEEALIVAEHAPRVLGAVPVGIALRIAGVADRSVRHEYLRALRAEGVRGTIRSLDRSITDRAFRHVVPCVVDARRAAGADTVAYRFAWQSPVKGGAIHCLDVPYFWNVLDEPHAPGLVGDHPPRALADTVHAAACAHIDGRGAGWPSWGSDRTVTVLGGSGGLAEPLSGGYNSVEPLLRG